jgi:hypothetical protein
MAKYEMGHTRVEIVADLKKEGIREAISQLILNTEKTHATYAGSNVVLPPIATSTVEEDDRCFTNMILSATDKIQEERETENGVPRGDESVSKHDICRWSRARIF